MANLIHTLLSEQKKERLLKTRCSRCTGCCELSEWRDRRKGTWSILRQVQNLRALNKGNRSVLREISRLECIEYNTGPSEVKSYSAIVSQSFYSFSRPSMYCLKHQILIPHSIDQRHVSKQTRCQFV